MGKHSQKSTPPKDGEVIVDQEDHTVYDTSQNPEREVGRTRTTPTRHDGSQGAR
jgi:hypothetical protein